MVRSGQRLAYSVDTLAQYFVITTLSSPPSARPAPKLRKNRFECSATTNLFAACSPDILTEVNLDAPPTQFETGSMPVSRRTCIVVMCLAGLVVNAATFGPALGLTARGTTDFMGFYAGGKLALSDYLYDPARVIDTEATSEGRSSPTRLFMRLPCFALFYRPLAQLSYPAASALWEILCTLSIVAFAVLWPARRGWHTALACCWSLPMWMTVAEGQDIGFLLLWIAVAAVLVRRKRPLAAGIVASLCLAKFHLFLMIPVWICARRQWRFASGILAGSAALFALSFAAGGWDWPLRYYALLREPSNNPYGGLMPNLHALFAGLPHAGAWEIAGLAVLGIAVWITSRKRADWGLAGALAGGILAAPHVYMADCALLIPAVLLVLRSRPPLRNKIYSWTRLLGFYLLTPLPWILLMNGTGFPARIAILAFVLSIGRQARKSRHIESLAVTQVRPPQRHLRPPPVAASPGYSVVAR
jgi:Glycosyltransferase family 87